MNLPVRDLRLVVAPFIFLKTIEDGWLKKGKLATTNMSMDKTNGAYVRKYGSYDYKKSWGVPPNHLHFLLRLQMLGKNATFLFPPDQTKLVIISSNMIVLPMALHDQSSNFFYLYISIFETWAVEATETSQIFRKPPSTFTVTGATLISAYIRGGKCGSIFQLVVNANFQLIMKIYLFSDSQSIPVWLISDAKILPGLPVSEAIAIQTVAHRDLPSTRSRTLMNIFKTEPIRSGIMRKVLLFQWSFKQVWSTNRCVIFPIFST